MEEGKSIVRVKRDRCRECGGEGRGREEVGVGGGIELYEMRRRIKKE